MSKKELLKIVLLYLLTTLLVVSVSFLADQFLPYKPSFPYAAELASRYSLPKWLYSFANFDGVHYLTIAREGYLHTGYIQAFFPLYPMLIFAGNFFIHNLAVTGLLLSQIFAFTTLLCFYYLVKSSYQERVAWNATLALATFLSSFFLHSYYNEGLFLTLIFLSLISFRKKNYFFASIFGILASATRVTGIFIFPMLVVLFFSQSHQAIKPFLKRNWLKILILSLSCFGFLAYAWYLFLEFKDPLYFFHVQSSFGAGRQTHLVLLPQVIWRYIKIFATMPQLDWRYYSYWQEFLVSLWALFLLGKMTWQTWQRQIRFKAGYLLFAWSSFLLPPLTGNFSSMPRYVLTCFPIFIYLGILWRKQARWKQYSYLALNLFLLLINTLLFIQGYWVA